MPCGLVFLGIVGAALGLFVGVAAAVCGLGWPGLMLWPAFAFGGAVLGFVCDVASGSHGS